MIQDGGAVPVPFKNTDFQLPFDAEFGQCPPERNVSRRTLKLLSDKRIRRENCYLMPLLGKFPCRSQAAPATSLV